MDDSIQQYSVVVVVFLSTVVLLSGEATGGWYHPVGVREGAVGPHAMGHFLDVIAVFLPSLSSISTAEFGAITPSVVLLCAYRRHDDSSPLHHDGRASIYESILRDPGITVDGIQNETTIPRSTLRYHLRILEEEGIITIAKLFGTIRYYPVNHGIDQVKAALSGEATAAIVESVARLEPVTVSRLATEVNRARSTVSYHLERLEAEGILYRERDGEAVQTYLAEETRTTLGQSLDSTAASM